MDQIIAGRFQTKGEADVAAALMANYVDKDDICIFHNNPPGQHGTYPVGSDEDADPGAREAETPTAVTAAAAGLTAGAIGALGGPVVALAAAGVAAYTGSLLGALNGLGDDSGSDHAPDRRHGGIILAVRVDDESAGKRVISDLEHQGAADIEKAKGEWRNGDWVDFNPVARPKLVAGPDPIAHDRFASALDNDASQGKASKEAKDSGMPDPVVYRVVFDEKKWVVLESSFQLSRAQFDTREAAISYAKALADIAPAARIEIYNEAGTLAPMKEHKNL